MCGRFTLDPTTKNFSKRFKISNQLEKENLVARYNIAPSLKRTPSSRQKRARIKIVCYRYEPKYTDAGV